MRSHGVSISVASSAFYPPKIHSLRVHFRLKKGQGAEGKGQKARGKGQGTKAKSKGQDVGGKNEVYAININRQGATSKRQGAEGRGQGAKGKGQGTKVGSSKT